MSQHKASTAAIKYALECDEGMDFLSYWNEGDFDACRRMWRDVPEEVFIGADPLHPKTVFDPLPFQVRVRDWAIRCFGKQIAADRPTRVQRFLEEALELAQSCSMSYSDVTTLVNYVYGRPHGVPAEEGPQVLLTLAALAEAYGFDLMARAEEELNRVNRPEVMERIQAKQASKPYNSPLPGTPDLGKIASGLGKSGKLSPLTAKAFANASRSMKDVAPLPLVAAGTAVKDWDDEAAALAMSQFGYTMDDVVRNKPYNCPGEPACSNTHIPHLHTKSAGERRWMPGRAVYMVLGMYGDESSWKEVSRAIYDRFKPAYRKIEYREVKDESPKSSGE